MPDAQRSYCSSMSLAQPSKAARVRSSYRPVDIGNGVNKLQCLRCLNWLGSYTAALGHLDNCVAADEEAERNLALTEEQRDQRLAKRFRPAPRQQASSGGAAEEPAHLPVGAQSFDTTPAPPSPPVSAAGTGSDGHSPGGQSPRGHDEAWGDLEPASPTAGSGGSLSPSCTACGDPAGLDDSYRADQFLINEQAYEFHEQDAQWIEAADAALQAQADAATAAANDAEFVPQDVHPRKWVEAAEQPVCELLDNAQRELQPEGHRPFSVRQAAACIFHTMRTTSSTFEAARQGLVSQAYGLLPGTPHPSNRNNRMPTSVHVCQVVLGVPGLDGYQVDLCADGCLHRFEAAPSDVAQRMRMCGGCALCQCQCGCKRWHQQNGKWVPQLTCYFMHDVLQQFFWDAIWYALVAASRQARSGTWFKHAAWRRLLAALAEHKYDMSLVRFVACRLVPSAPRMWCQPRPLPPRDPCSGCARVVAVSLRHEHVAAAVALGAAGERCRGAVACERHRVPRVRVCVLESLQQPQR